MTDKDTQVIQKGKTTITKNNGVTVIKTKGKPKLILFNDDDAIRTPNPILDPLEQKKFIEGVRKKDKKRKEYKEWIQGLRDKT